MRASDGVDVQPVRQSLQRFFLPAPEDLEESPAEMSEWASDWVNEWTLTVPVPMQNVDQDKYLERGVLSQTYPACHNVLAPSYSDLSG